jgi:hypothetical protein
VLSTKALDSTRVIPFLFRVPSPELSEPLRQFQYVTYEKEDVRKMIGTVNKMCEHSLEDSGLSETFDMWWPRLQSALDPIPDVAVQKQLNSTTTEDNTLQPILEELLDLARDQQRRLSSGRIMAPEDLEMIIRHMDRSAINPRLMRDIAHEVTSMRRMLMDMKGLGLPDQILDAFREKISHVESAIERLERPATRARRMTTTAEILAPIEEALNIRAVSKRPKPESDASNEVVPWDDGEPPF